jgi:S-DNA-T family DNA segregation ATPase FtsK/SpoIIIE
LLSFFQKLNARNIFSRCQLKTFVVEEIPTTKVKNFYFYDIISKMKKRKKTNTQEKKALQKKRLLTDIFFLLLFFLTLFLLISLLSYHPLDPTWASTSTDWTKTHNYGGRLGASLADTFFQFIGLSSFLLVIILGYIFTSSFFRKQEREILNKFLGLLLILISSSGLLAIIIPQVEWRQIRLASGGLAGTIFSSFCLRWLNQLGSILFLIVLLLIGSILAFNLSVRRLFSFWMKFIKFFFKELRLRIIHYRKEKTRQKMRQKIQEKYLSSQKKKSSPPRRPTGPTVVSPPPPPPTPPSKSEGYLFPELAQRGDYRFPPVTLLEASSEVEQIDKKELFEKKQIIEAKLREFRVGGEVREYHPGPVITTYEFYPSPGITVSQVANRSEDLSLALGAESVRIQRIPGKSSLGIEVPNNKREIIRLRDIIQSENFQRSPSKLTYALGKTIHGEVYITDLAVMPHLLLAGATGTGKSVALNTLIISILYKATPEEVKLILIDPKRLEFNQYDGIPHLLCPVVRDAKKAGAILLDAVKRMEERYRLLSEAGVRHIEQYNLLVQQGKISPPAADVEGESPSPKSKILPYLVIIIDELAELMMIGAQDVEYCIARLAQLARAVGIHLVMATQRPSIDVITGTVKNNFPSRIAFRVPSKVDSRIIIDTVGAEKLLGNGDMLFLPPHYPRLIRLHGSFISLPEITRIVNYIKKQRKPEYDEKIINVLKGKAVALEDESTAKDPLYEKAVELILLTGQASASYLQRKLKLGYNRAARIIDQMEQEGILGPSEGSKPREILVDPQEYLTKFRQEG